MKKVKILSLGDIHLGHPNNKTDYIVNSLQQYFKKNIKLFKNLTHIELTGDLFHKALLSYSSEYIQSMAWLFELVMFCSKNNIKLRILEGTPSHDNNQGKLLVDLIKKWEIPIDFRYISDIEIEYDSDYNIHVLYVPDRNDKPASERFKIIKRKMLDLKIKQVDFAFMHGVFKYQLPIQSEETHDMDDFLEIVKYYIVINHIHIPSVYDRILGPGSFERLNHNEEEDKGGIYVEVGDNDARFIFIKNEFARLFKTFRIESNLKLDKILKDLHKSLKDLPHTSFIRLLSYNKLGISKELKDKYNFVEVKEESITKEKKANIRDLFNIVSDVVELHLTKDNIVDLVTKELDGVDSKYINIIRNKIEKINSEYL